MDHNQPYAASEETRMLRDLLAKFVERDLMPLEPAVLKREATGGGFKLFRLNVPAIPSLELFNLTKRIF